MTKQLTDRAIGCFLGLATGDAVGKQSEMLSRAEVLRWYPGGIHGFQGRPGVIIPRYRGNRNREWRIGETTDDTEQTIAVAKAILADGRATHTSVGRELLQCRKSAHSGVRSIWTFQQAGNPARVATEGNGCGAAMRVSPVGILHPSGRLDVLVQAAYESSIPTHGGALAVAAAAAVAAAISASVDSMPHEQALKLAVAAAEKGEVLIAGPGHRTMASRIAELHADLSTRERLLTNELAESYFPDRPETIVPLAVALALVTCSAEQTILLAANIGGDADSVASIGGAIAGAMHPESVNQEWVDVVHAVNQQPLVELAGALARLRAQHRAVPMAP